MPMDRRRYPPNWEQIALEIKNQADWTCKECELKCLEPNQGKHLPRSRKAKLTLTVHHIDCMPENSHPSNLIALCSACHLKTHRKPKLGKL